MIHESAILNTKQPFNFNFRNNKEGRQLNGNNEENENNIRILELLNEIGKDIISNLSISRIVQTVYENINLLLDATIFVLGVYNEDEQYMEFWGIKEKGETTRIGRDTLDNNDLWFVTCFNKQEEILVNDFGPHYEKYFTHILFAESAYSRKSFIYLPLTLRRKKIGILSVQCYRENAYNEYHLNILRNLANYITIALTNASAYQRIEKQKEEIVLKSEKIQKAHEHLEELVKERTEEITRQNIEIQAKNRILEHQKEEILTKSFRLEEINKELKMLSIVAKQTDNAIMIMDAIGNVLWINDCFTRIYKYNYEQFIAARGGNILHTSFNPVIRETLEKCLSEKKSVFYEALNITLSGEKIWTQTTLTPILDKNGNITNLVTIDSDITKIKEAEKKIIKQNNNIKNSIQYASYIQNAVLPPLEMINNIFPENFVLYQPKDIVSGDFYWIRKLRNQVILVVADCTGHGVPGAFMSLLGIEYLNEIVSNQKPICPNKGKILANEILNQLREKVKTSLNQSLSSTENKDGMDIVCCVINLDNLLLQFAGAYNSGFILRDSPENIEARIIEYKGDKMPIGIHFKERPSFTNHEFQLEKGDTLYFTTDGYFHQFGGPFGKKYMKNSFKDLLLCISDKSMSEQKEILNQVIEDWRKFPDKNGKISDQIDDLLVLGIKV